MLAAAGGSQFALRAAQLIEDPLPGAVITPGREGLVDPTLRRQDVKQHVPLAAGPIEREYRVEEFTEQAFASFLEVAPGAVVVADHDGQIVRINAQTERMFQYSRPELVGRPIEVLIPERFRERHILQQTADSTEPLPRPMGNGPHQLYGLHKECQKFPIEISLAVLLIRPGTLGASAIRAVTLQNRLEVGLNPRTP